ncbi:MAG: JAB domain-containing protein [Faecalibacillus faecis]
MQEKLLFIGSGDASMLETKEVFQHTLRCGANRIILIHNHPSGNPAPSVEDELITQKIKEMAGLFRNRVHRSSNCWQALFL